MGSRNLRPTGDWADVQEKQMDRESNALMLGTQVALQALIAAMYSNEQIRPIVIEAKKLALSTAALANSNEYKGAIGSDIELMHKVIELTFSQVK